MEKIFAFVLFIIVHNIKAQSISLNPTNSEELIINSTSSLQQVVARFNGRGESFTSLYINNNNPSTTTATGIGFLKNSALLGYVGVNSAKDLTFGRINLSAGDLKVRGDGVNAGNVGIGLSFAEPTAKLHINGFTKLGSDAPAIKVKKLTGTSAASQGGVVQISHGLTPSKILDIRVLIEYSTGDYVPHSYESVSQFKYEWVSEDGIIYIRNISGNSSQILSKPIKILITYEE